MAQADKQPPAKKQAKKKLDLGVVNLTKLNKADLAVPGKDVKVLQVGLKATVTGETAKDEKLSVFVAVNPISNADAKEKDTFWIQKVNKGDGTKFKAVCQFGKGDLGKGEYFAVIAFTSKSELVDGDQLDLAGVQKAAVSYSPVLIIQRKK